MIDDSPWFHAPPPPQQPPRAPAQPEPPRVSISIDGQTLSVPANHTILQACRSIAIDTPTLCYLENLTPVNVCRVCVVELKGARTLIPACSRQVEPSMEILTDSPRVRLARKLVLEFLASSVDLSTAPETLAYCARYNARPERMGPPISTWEQQPRDLREPGHHNPLERPGAETVAQPVKIDNDLYVRDYSKCILCYKCVEACGADAQNTFAIAVAGRGFDARISTEANVPLPESACVYCGNCIGVCPTGALMFRSEYDMRKAGRWDPSRQSQTDTICPYCGVGCTLTLHVQDHRIVKVTSPLDVPVTRGHLCIKGRFGFEFVHSTEDGPAPNTNNHDPAAEPLPSPNTAPQNS